MTVLKTVLVAGVTPGVGKTLVLNGLQTYCQRHYPDQSLEQMVFPTLTPKALEQGLEPELGPLWRSLCQTQQTVELLGIEGEGSLASPITQDTTLATLAKEWRLPVLLVVPVDWEAIAPTIATLALAREANVTLVGVILNQVQSSPNIAPEAMVESLRAFAHVPILGCIPFLEQPEDDEVLVNLASQLMLDAVIDKIEPLKT